jgi:hypothetical protein
MILKQQMKFILRAQDNEYVEISMNVIDSYFCNEEAQRVKKVYFR